jgi:hypothetical protein
VPPRPSETDLLDLIEGSLSPAREREVRAAVATDKALSDELRRMMQQRSMLKQLGESFDHAAPADLAEQAVLVARTQDMERMNQDSAAAGRLRFAQDEGRATRRRAMAIAATFALLVVAGWVWFLIGSVGPNGTVNEPTFAGMPHIEIDRTEEKRLRAEGKLIEPDPALAARSELALRLGVDPDFVGPPERLGMHADPALANATTPSGSSSSLLDEWTANLGTADTASTLSPTRAAELLSAGKLRIVVEAVPSAETRDRVFAAAKGQGGLLASASEVRSELPPGLDNTPDYPEVAPRNEAAAKGQALLNARNTLVVAIEPSKDRAEVASRLEHLLREVSSAAGAQARFDEAVPSEDPMAGLEAADLLWWTRPSDQWQTRPVLKVPVVFGGTAQPPAIAPAPK